VPLTKGGNTHSGSLEKVNILNDQFTSMLTAEDTTNVPIIGDVVRSGTLKLELVLTVTVALFDLKLMRV
jgi:hypothetical protein